MKTFIVAYCIRQISEKDLKPREVFTDHYRSFIEENEGKSPEEQANNFYNYLVDEKTFKGNKSLYSANICEIVKSTEAHYIDDNLVNAKVDTLGDLEALINSCNEAISGNWNSSMPQAEQGFNDMIELLERVKNYVL